MSLQMARLGDLRCPGKSHAAHGDTVAGQVSQLGTADAGTGLDTRAPSVPLDERTNEEGGLPRSATA